LKAFTISTATTLKKADTPNGLAALVDRIVNPPSGDVADLAEARTRKASRRARLGQVGNPGMRRYVLNAFDLNQSDRPLCSAFLLSSGDNHPPRRFPPLTWAARMAAFFFHAACAPWAQSHR